MEPKDSIRVLYIEDDPGSRMLVQKVLNRAPFFYMDAPDGLSGLRIAQAEKPDLILMDLNLPDISGNELTTKIKNTPELKNIIVVALTALQNSYARELTLIAGCDGYLSKPIDVQKFPQQVMQFLKGKKEFVETGQKDYLHSQYEIHLVEHLTSKVKELEVSNRKLASTYGKLQDYNNYLENVLSIFTHLQTCKSPNDLKKSLVDEICDRFQYDRCIFIDVDSEQSVMQINYARGIEQDEWQNYSYPFNSPFFQKLFETKQVLLVPNLDRVKDADLRQRLRKMGTDHFLFAYLGMPMDPAALLNIRERVMPMLEPYLPNLYDEKESDIDVILGNFSEYLHSESLYRAGFVFLDNPGSKRHIQSNEYRFLETLFRTATYLYQNLLLMEQLRDLFIRAEKEAITDPLTNLFNYRFFMQQLNREISRDQRHKAHFSLIILDIDFFKTYNDSFGHQAGDMVLRRLANTLIENTRSSDVVARYGGEEFVIICPELNKQGAIQVAEKLRQIIEKIEFPNIGKLPHGKLTISLGIATFPEDGETSYRLIRGADTALYKAKQNGRNKVYVSDNGDIRR